MKLKFLGAAGTVTGSSYILTSGSGASILIDLGLFLGTHDLDALNYEPYDFDCSLLSGAVLTHAHLDHCGRLPILIPNNYKGSIWMTPPTRDLTELSLLDSANLAKNTEKERILFDRPMAEQTFTRFMTTDYAKPTQVGDFTVTMRDAGHILGSASLEIVDNHPESAIQKIVFSGDLGNSPEDLLRKTELIDRADAVVMESTYGDRLHPHAIAADDIQREINAVEQSGGTLLIPAFALERTQEILHIMMHLKKSRKILSDTPVFLDSPMAERATTIYNLYPMYLNDHMKDEFAFHPFEFPGLVRVGKRQESEKIHTYLGPKVIVAGSGMMTGGRILGHAAYYLSRPDTRVFIVGYQSPETLGAALLRSEKKVKIEGKSVEARATIGNTQSMSSHADQTQLVNWLRPIKGVKKIFLTHGDDIPRAALAKKISEELNHYDITLPKMNEEITL